MKGFNPNGLNEEYVPVYEKPTNVAKEIFLVAILFFLVRIVMLTSGIVFMAIPYLDPVAHQVINFVQGKFQ